MDHVDCVRYWLKVLALLRVRGRWSASLDCSLRMLLAALAAGHNARSVSVDAVMTARLLVIKLTSDRWLLMLLH